MFFPTQVFNDVLEVCDFLIIGLNGLQIASPYASSKGTNIQMPLAVIDGHGLDLTARKSSVAAKFTVVQ